MSEDRPVRTLREILKRLNEAYCDTIGYEVGCAPAGGVSVVGRAQSVEANLRK